MSGGWDWWTCSKCGQQTMKRMRRDGQGFLQSALGRCVMCPPKVIPKAIKRYGSHGDPDKGNP